MATPGANTSSVSVLAAYVSLAIWVLGTTIARGQATFTAGVNTVGTYVSVVSNERAPLPRLSATDFEIRDDGKLRPVTLFEAGTLPITIVILLDDSPSMRASQPSARSAAAALVRRLTPQDRATVGIFSRSVRLEGELTSDQEQLLSRLQVPSPLMAGTALWDAIFAGIAAVEDESGRRVVLVLSDGDDNSSEIAASVVAARATSEGVMVYGIGIHGEQGRLRKDIRHLTRDTGGSFVELKGTDSLATAFQRVADELHSQYLLGFSLDHLDGKLHRLEVTVKRRGLTARTRRSYVASLQTTTTAR